MPQCSVQLKERSVVELSLHQAPPSFLGVGRCIFGYWGQCQHHGHELADSQAEESATLHRLTVGRDPGKLLKATLRWVLT